MEKRGTFEIDSNEQSKRVQQSTDYRTTRAMAIHTSMRVWQSITAYTTSNTINKRTEQDQRRQNKQTDNHKIDKPKSTTMNYNNTYPTAPTMATSRPFGMVKFTSAQHEQMNTHVMSTTQHETTTKEMQRKSSCARVLLCCVFCCVRAYFQV